MLKVLNYKAFFASVRLMHSNTNDIYFNLATEEYLFQEAELNSPTLFLWRNSPTIVIGKHQNPWKECQVDKMKQKGIKISRRKTGGGAVYQDLGNTCFSFLTPYNQRDPINYRTVNNQILTRCFRSFGVPAEISGRNDIIVDSKKISGSAYRLHLGDKSGKGKKALHHGTVLFSVDIDVLHNYLSPSRKKLQSKGIESIRSRVMNLNEQYPSLTHDVFCKRLGDEFISYYKAQPQQVNYELLDHDILQQNHKIQANFSRLKSWEWLFGECPQFSHQIQHKFDWALVTITFEVEDGHIKQSRIFSDCLVPEFIQICNDLFKGIQYSKEGVQQFRCNLNTRLESPEQLKMSSQLAEWLKTQI